VVLGCSVGCFGAACSGGGTVLEPDLGVPDTADVRSAPDLVDVWVPDVPTELPPLDDVLPDPGEVGPECFAGSGCFGEPCQEGADCLSGHCVEHMGEAVCTRFCEEECPAGFTCKLLAETMPDATYICVSLHPNLCKPCSINSDCKSYGATDDVCVGYGAEGSFCGGTCALDSDCPWGFACKSALSVDGIETKQCVAAAGVCPCTASAVLKGLFTPCSVGNEWGTCEGKRVCTQDGLTPCDALVPAAESCNGIDDDCDGMVDDPDLVQGKFVDLCDDGNPCTQDACAGEGGCTHEDLTSGECIDGDACTVGDHCEAGVCTGLPVVCDDGNPCTDDLCDGQGGCTAKFNSAPCDDGDPCTVADSCAQGTCAGYAVDCNCQDDEDCAVLEDGDLCNGTLVCDTGSLPFQCAVAPETVVVCPQPQGAASICSKSVCTPENGQCGLVPDHEGFACDDGDPCTIGDACQAGACVAGVAAGCEDANPCTTDYCVPKTGCIHQENALPCNDGDSCTVGDLCAAGQCKGGPALSCDDGNPCTLDGCDPGKGCTHAPQAGECDDGNGCTTGDYCKAGKCVFTAGTDCNDSNPCTKDSCNPLAGCAYQVVAGPCDDGNPCTLNDSCKNGLCVPGAAPDCNDSNPCTADSCENGLCVHAPLAGACNDGNACTQGDVCEAGKCIPGAQAGCDDAEPCTTDSCDPKTGCVHFLNTAPCDDGNLCTTGDKCDKGKCGGGTPLACNDSNLCTDDSCDAKSGCVFTPNTAPCNDGSVCTQGDACSKGWCAGGPPVSCDDKNPCTDDLCDFQLGCQHFDNSVPCNDLNACTANEFCAKGACGGGVPIVCEDKNPCTDDTCVPQTGCVFTNNTVACTDGSACTTGDVCKDGKCLSGNPTDCDDGNSCTTDTCDPATGCKHVPVANDTPCGAELWCQAGSCVPTLKCPAATGKKTVFTSSQTWQVPGDVKHLRILVIGGGGGGAQGHGNGGGSGHVRKHEFDIEPCTSVTVTVGNGGTSNTDGQASSFGAYKSASGGSAGQQNASGSGAGGSGGGGAGNAGCGGDGGTGGSKGQDGCTYTGGAGGNFDAVIGGVFKQASITHGAGGAKGTSSHAGGGGGGGALIDGQGTGGAKGEYSWSALGGAGYGGGGGGGGYNGPYAIGGTGGKGVVYVEWD
jgi:hypothetical protein